jgi:hypothetical protein
MAEACLHDLDVESGSERVRCRAVAEAVEADRRELRLERQAPEPVAYCAGMQRRFVFASEHEPGADPCLPHASRSAA